MKNPLFNYDLSESREVMAYAFLGGIINLCEELISNGLIDSELPQKLINQADTYYQPIEKYYKNPDEAVCKQLKEELPKLDEAYKELYYIQSQHPDYLDFCARNRR